MLRDLYEMVKIIFIVLMFLGLGLKTSRMVDMMVEIRNELREIRDYQIKDSNRILNNEQNK